MENDPTRDTGMTIVTIPSTQTQAVLDFVAGLDTGDTDVTGHMLSTGAYRIGGGTLAEKSTSSTNCKISRTGTHGTDFTCSDTDTIVT